MDPLLSNKWALTWLCVYPTAKTTSNWKIWAHRVFTVTVLFGLLCGTASHLAYFMKFKSTDLEGSLFGFMGFASFFALDYVMLFVYSQRNQVISIFEELAVICDGCKYKFHISFDVLRSCQSNSIFFFAVGKHVDSFQFLIDTNNTSERIWALYVKYLSLIFIVNGFGCVASTYISCTINGHFDANYVIHMTKIVAPWNQTTLVGYLGEDFYIIYFAVIFGIVAGLLLLLFISICIYHLAFYKMIEHSIGQSNHKHDRMTNDRQFIFRLISFHIEIKK